MKIAEDKLFLEMQRKKGRPGCMAGVDMKLYEREKRAEVRKEKEDARKRKHEEEMSQQKGIVAIFERIYYLDYLYIVMGCGIEL